MEESAFEEPPWLLEREGAGYVQVTELLYRIAEACDGQRTLAEIAERVSEQTGREVSADNVKQLVGTQLLLKGLVQTADGKVVGATAGARSMLGLQARAKVFGPEAVEPVARLSQALFWPPVLAAALLATLLAQGWLVLHHGVANSTRDLLYAPGLLLVALLATALAAGFHELGHAAALRYGGGRAKAMGVGLYLLYPAFYTDVSDNYRLPRWPRVRTDLGGIYFHLVFTLGLMGLWAVTGWEFLLAIVLLVDLDAVRQLMPLLRLDGYWVLADLTGVPDFWSRMGAFARRVLPIGGREQDKLPPLKWWGTLVFALYALLAIPLVAFMAFMMLRSLPRVLATAWDSAHRLGAAFAQAQAGGNVGGMALAGGQVLLLGIPTLAMVYSVLRLGYRLGRGVWRWSQPSPTRRVIGGLGTVGALGLLVYLWAPQLPFAPPGRSGPLYSGARDSFVPIQAQERGTVGEAFGRAAPAASDQPVPTPVPSPLPSLLLSPTVPIVAPASPVPTAPPTAGPTTAPTAAVPAKPAVPLNAPPAPPAVPTAEAPAPATAVGTAVPTAVPTTASPTPPGAAARVAPSPTP
jgi:putative peptide zinc metalloprotease protein